MTADYHLHSSLSYVRMISERTSSSGGENMRRGLKQK